MPVTRNQQYEHLPGYKQVYLAELNKRMLDGLTSTVIPTNDVSLHTFMIKYTQENTFRIKPPGLFRSPATFVALWITVMATWMVIACIKAGSYQILAVPLVMMGFSLYKVGRPLFIKSFRFTMLVNAAGITLNREHFAWSQLIGTYIVKHDGYKHYDAFLVLVPTDGTPRYFSLAAFGNNAPKFATAITHFKPAPVSPH